MPIATTGLILRQIKVGEADRILTILTPDLGVISASAKGSMRLKNKLFSATGLFCYSEFSLTSGRSHYFIDTAQIKNVFHGISATVEGMGLASYMAEIAACAAGIGSTAAAAAQLPVYAQRAKAPGADAESDL